MQRLRIRFSRGEEISLISHLDLMRLWQRALRRAGIPLAYSEGFNPHPRLSLAAPLALGITSEAELMDVFIIKEVSPHFFINTVGQQLPFGIEIQQVYHIAKTVPALQSLMRYAEYRVKVEITESREQITAKLESLLAKKNLPWQHRRDTGTRNYDLRALIDDLWLVDCQGSSCTIGMRLRCDNNGSGRPEQVSAALGFTSLPQLIHRTGLILQTS